MPNVAITSLILPMYNPGLARLTHSFRRLEAFVGARPEPWELLFVCDGCSDGSAALLEELAARSAVRVRVIAYPRNRGKGHAVRTGLLAAAGRWRLFTDIDLAYAPEDVLRLAERLWAGEPAVIAVREPAHDPVPRFSYAAWRRLQSRTFASLVRWLLKMPLRDTQAGLKGFSAAWAADVAPRLACDGFAFDCELLLASQRRGWPIGELPVSLAWTDSASTIRPHHAFRMLGELWSMRRRWRRRPAQAQAKALKRRLVVVADDLGAGPQVSAGILECAKQGLLTATLLQTNSPYAEDAVRAWRRAGEPCALGWHPCLTMDRPLTQAPSLTDASGAFRGLGGFLRRWLLGRLNASELKAELAAQLKRFLELVGRPPAYVAGHHHCQLFAPVGALLLELLQELQPRPWVRQVTESASVRRLADGSRLKRAALGRLGRVFASEAKAAGFRSPENLLGLAAPAAAERPDGLTRWLAACTANAAELMCHPGYEDPTLTQRDPAPAGWRSAEMARLLEPSFRQALAEAGLSIVRPEELTRAAEVRHAA